MNAVVPILSYTALLIGSATAILQVVIFGRNKASTEEMIRNLEQDREDKALSSADLQILGDYLYDSVGSITLFGYATNPDISKKVRRALDRVATFLGPEPPDVPESHVRSVEPKESLAPPSISQELEKSKAEILYGEVWNGLARMRRALEIELRTLAPEEIGKRKGKPVSLYTLINGMRASGLIAEEVSQQLRYAVQVANFAIHGEAVSQELAEEAWRNAAMAMTMAK